MNQDINRRKLIAWLWQVVLFVGVYLLAVRLDLSTAYMQSNISPVWRTTGIALAALLLFDASRWPGITFGVLLCSLQTGEPSDLARGMSIGNTLQALVRNYVLQRYVNFQHAIDRVRDVTGLVVVTIISPMLSPIVCALYFFIISTVSEYRRIHCVVL
jgi:integral membrane sensor domain MASE1